MLEALHLDAAERPVAVLLDGPSLRLRRVGVADVFAPLPRLARVVVHGSRVQWRTEALLACAEAGVPVLLLSGRGALRAVLVPVLPPAQRRDLAALLEAAATVPGFRAMLEDFCRAELRRAAIAALRAEGIRPETVDLRPGMPARRWQGGAEGVEARCFAWQVLRGLGSAAIAEGLARRGVGPQFLARRTGCFPLPELLGEALVLPLSPALARMMPDLAAMPEAAARRALIGLFESADPNGQRDRMLARLAVRLAAET
jgi:hypothetical protein